MTCPRCDRRLTRPKVAEPLPYSQTKRVYHCRGCDRDYVTLETICRDGVKQRYDAWRRRAI